MTTNSTHDPARRSWVESANHDGADFPIQNLPYGIFRAGDGVGHVGVAIGEKILDLRALAEAELLPVALREALSAPNLNALMSHAPENLSRLRAALSDLLSDAKQGWPERENFLFDQHKVAMQMPAAIGDYTDFYASVHHATNVGSMFRPDNPLLPNYKWIPVGYHGRASTVVLSDTPVRRPSGQLMHDGAKAPIFGPSRLLDYELELGFFVGRGNAHGEAIPIGEAERHIFGVCLVNDWSARDVQKWEYQPLGPFLAKSFITSISPWIVTMEALAPFRIPAYVRPESDPQPLPHLFDEDDRARGGLDIELEVHLATVQMREKGLPPMCLSRGNFATMYWTLAQMLTHHASNGCLLRSGDLLASGTVSGPEADSRGSLLELAWRGSEPVVLPTGEERKFLADGDELILRGHCRRDGTVRIGLGECRGIVQPATTVA